MKSVRCDFVDNGMDGWVELYVDDIRMANWWGEGYGHPPTTEGVTMIVRYFVKQLAEQESRIERLENLIESLGLIDKQ